MSENDDIAEFVEAADGYSEQKSYVGTVRASDDYADAEKDEEPKPGQPVQYALYRGGYTATTSTVNSLPSGCYDIEQDSNCVYATPTLPPSGLLLELPEMRSDEVIRVVENFWESEKDYKEGNEFVIGGASYKAGVMIYGPPGSGKSCTIKIVSKKIIQRGGTVFYAGGHPLSVISFLESFSRIEPNRKSVVILEDFDALISNYGEGKYLEMLDSAKTIDNVLFIATTNYPDRLDPRIYNRPGRFSHVIKIGYPEDATREAFLKAILKPGIGYRDVEYIVKESKGFTIDHLSALINAVYREKKDLVKEIARLRTLFKIPKSDDSKPMGIGNR